MAYSNTIGIIIAAKNEASAVLTQVATDAKATSEAVATTTARAEATQAATLKKMGTNLKDTGSILTTSITLPVLAVSALSMDLAYKFNNAMELLHTSAGIPQDQIASLSDKVLALAGTTGQAPEQLAKGLYHVASAGNGIWNTSQQLDILKVAADGANIGMANLDDTTYALTSAMASGVKGATGPQSMMGVLSSIVGAGDMKMGDLNAALGTGILSTAASFGTSVQSIGSALATLTDNGEHADEAATRLRMTMALMASPSGAASKQLEALGLTAENAKQATSDMNTVFAKSGLTTTKLADDLRQPNGISVAVKDLKKHLEDAGLSASESDAMLAKAFGGGRTDAALLTLLQNTDRMDAKFGTINKDAGNMQKKLDDLNKTPNQQLREAWSSMQASLIKIGDDLLPKAAKAVQFVAKEISGLVTWWGTLDAGQKTAIEWLVGMLAVGGPLLKGTGAVIKDVQTIGSTFGSVMKVVGAGGVMGGIATAGAMADIALVLAAVQSIQSAMDAVNGAKAAMQNDMQVTKDMEAHNNEVQSSGVYSAETKAKWQKAVDRAHALDKELLSNALGTNFSPGGMTMVGENGPELVNLPAGSKVHTAKETQQMSNGSKGVTVNIANWNNNNNMDEDKFLAKLGWRLSLA
ncbi:phage tail tape measure protein [Cryobacterium sp. GrIS_2_6]|uniref:phage tail tape measure protein n=1 Tax=Cryobacterium sp. GrIS_2_6 TaxID=3162785 RepID=UPI002E059EA0|nr:phage tail tape measure protein [Cryobacterium psychrotolerans]MEC5150868.1 hypothetical protein [Cryobacterium psychrotolerans]